MAAHRDEQSHQSDVTLSHVRLPKRNLLLTAAQGAATLHEVTLYLAIIGSS